MSTSLLAVHACARRRRGIPGALKDTFAVGVRHLPDLDDLVRQPDASVGLDEIEISRDLEAVLDLSGRLDRHVEKPREVEHARGTTALDDIRGH